MSILLRNTGRLILLLIACVSLTVAQSTDSTKAISTKKARTRTAQQTTVSADSTKAAVEPAKTTKQRQIDKTVYVTRTGEKYHADGCRYLRKSSIPMKLSEAKKSYSPCSVCTP